ncbi:SulP family inorganic anion transporter [Sphingomonas japonica]|nr:SulP family inorganic anion transporter [Sphingomonas japonica]
MSLPSVKDVAASFVVFLVALPLCLGIAIASGAPPELGLITGIVGGIVVGFLAGSPLQVSGPAAGLAVIVYDLITKHGLETLGPVLMLAGVLQLGAGLLRWGGWFRGVSPAVVHGMLAGIGALIVLQQFHVLVDDSPLGTGLQNMAAIPGQFLGLTSDGAALQAAIVGVVTILGMVGWEKFKPASLRLVPGALVGVILGILTATAGGLGVKRIDLPSNIFAGVSLPGMDTFGTIADPTIIGLAIAIAFIASAETLLSAAAVDRMQDKVQTQYNRELGAQGVGNFICGVLGALPMTGVIVRSSANVQAGADTRASTIMHGMWLLAFVALLPAVLALVPTAALAGVLVVTGWKLIKFKDVRHLFNNYGILPALIWAATFVLVVTVDLLTGVIVGLALSMIELIPHFRRMRLKIEEQGHGEADHAVTLQGKATVLQVNRVTQLLDRLPARGRLKLDVSKLEFVDHTVSELITEALQRKKRSGLDVRLEGDGPNRHAKLAAAVA